MKKVFLVIDFTVDFVADEGALTCGKLGQEIEESIVSLTKQKKMSSVYSLRYSAFAGTNMQQLLNARKIEEIHLVGVCTEICILHTAVDAYNLGYEIDVHEDGVASFNPAGHEWALDHFSSSLNAKVKKIIDIRFIYSFRWIYKECEAIIHS